MNDINQIAIYSNIVAIMLVIGITVLAAKFNIKDEWEKKIFLSLLVIFILMSIAYIVTGYRDAGILECSSMAAVLIETSLEYLINLFAFQWFIYVDYRMFHSTLHIRRNGLFFTAGFAIMMLLDTINIFTGILFTFTDSTSYAETPLYIVTDLIRLVYFFGTIFALIYYRRKDERMKFFHVRSFFIPMAFYVLLYYVTPMNTVTLGLSIGLTLIFVQMVNEQCYQDGETGFFNDLYLDYLRGRIEGNDYDLQSVMFFKLPGEDMATSSKLIAEQLPDECQTIRLDSDTIVTLTHVKDRSPLFMVSEDVQMSLEEAGIPVEVSFELKKKKESGADFLDRVLRKA